MDALYESAKTYGEILRNCSIPQVADWDIEDIQRAHKWASYFHKVQERIAKKPSTVHKLDTRLREIGHQLGVRFGGEEFSCDFLAHSSEYFTRCLLDNTLLSGDLCEEECALSPNIAQKHISEQEDTELLLSTLRGINEKLCTHDSGASGFLEDWRSLDAVFLRKDLSWLVERQSSSKMKGVSVRQRLSSLAEVEGGMAVILTALCQDSNDDNPPTPVPPTPAPPAPADPDSLEPARRAIFDWIMTLAGHKQVSTLDVGQGAVTMRATDQSDDMQDAEQDLEEGNVSAALWHKEHCKLLAQVSARYFDFFKAHFKFLAHKTKQIEKRRLENINLQPSEGAGVETGGGDPVDSASGGELADLAQEVEWATCHWVELCLACEELRATCVSFLSKELAGLEESTYEGITMTVPARDSLWHQLLVAVETAASGSRGK